MITPKAIHLLIPVTYKNRTEEERRIEELRPWLDGFTDKVKDKYDIVPHPYFAYTGSKINAPGFIIRFKGQSNKGLWVRSSIFSISTKYGYSDFKNIFIILIDGSGKIPYAQVEDILHGLVNGSPVVMGCRVDGNWTKDENRLIAEEYEKFIIENFFGVELPDTQCGCWGFRGDVIKDLSLISNFYDIELDILINTLENNLDILYVPINTEEGESTFNEEANEKKINYLAHKLNHSAEDFLELYEDFKRKTKKELPEKGYLEFIKKVDSSSMQNKNNNISCLAHKRSDKCNSCKLKK